MHPRDRAGGLDQHRGQPLVAVPRAGRCAFAGRLVHRRRQPGPRGQVAADGNRDMSAPVSAMITCAIFDPDPGNGLQQLELVRPRLARGGDHRVQLGQRRLDQVEPVQDRTEPAGHGGRRSARSAPRPDPGSCGASCPWPARPAPRGSRSPSIIARQHRPRRDRGQPTTRPPTA